MQINGIRTVLKGITCPLAPWSRLQLCALKYQAKLHIDNINLPCRATCPRKLSRQTAIIATQALAESLPSQVQATCLAHPASLFLVPWENDSSLFHLPHANALN